MKRTISALVINRPGVLAEMAEEFRKYRLNITSISAGETERSDITRMVIQAEAEDDDTIRVLTEGMETMDAVISVDDLSRREFVDRELVMLKVAMDRDTTSQIMQIVEVFRASVIAMGRLTLTVELSGDQERVEGLIRMLTPFGIKSMCRTGMIALKRGDE